MANDNNVTGLVNRALSFLGEQKITNCDAPETPAGKSLVESYPMCRREVLRRVSWNFAENWGTLNYVASAPKGFDYSDIYALPADYIRVVDIPGGNGSYSVDYSDEDCSIQDYRLIQFNGQRCIALSNNASPTLNMAYVADITNLTTWDPLALKVLALWMALDVAKSITGQAATAKTIDDQLTNDLQDAVGVNGNEQRKRTHGFSKVKRERALSFSGDASFFTPVSGFYPGS